MFNGITAAETTAGLNDNITGLNTDKTVAPLQGGSGDFTSVIIAYVIIILVIAGIFVLFRKYLLNKVTGVKNGTYMRVYDRLVLSQDKQIVMIELQEKILILGVASQRIDILHIIDKNECAAFETPVMNINSQFGNILDGILKKKNGNKKDE